MSDKSSLSAFFFHPPFTQNFWPDILEEIYKKQVYQRFMPNIKEGSICVDLGANVGLASYYFSFFFEKVLAVEPSKQHLEALYSMIKQNKLSNVIVVPSAMSNKNGTTRFYHNENQTMFSMESTVNNPKDFEEVETIDFETLFEKYKIDHIDLLKLDVEGSEGLVIESEAFKKLCPKIKVIAGEWHQWSSMSKDNFAHALMDLGYTFKWKQDTQASVFEAELL